MSAREVNSIVRYPRHIQFAAATEVKTPLMQLEVLKLYVSVCVRALIHKKRRYCLKHMLNKDFDSLKEILIDLRHNSGTFYGRTNRGLLSMAEKDRIEMSDIRPVPNTRRNIQQKR